MLDPSLAFLVVQGALTGVAKRLAEHGVDRLLDGSRQAVHVPEPPKRHQLGDVTSDVDIVVRHQPAGPRVVLLAFQIASGWEDAEMPQGVTVPMRLGETAHLTLPRDEYVISALVLEGAAKVSGKPVLHGIGRRREWVLGNATEQIAITTNPPSEKTLRKLRLLKPDGTSPFELPPAPPRPRPGTPPAAARPAPDARIPAGSWTTSDGRSFEISRQCRAATSRFGPRCTAEIDVLSRKRLCLRHGEALNRGETVYDWSYRRKIV